MGMQPPRLGARDRSHANSPIPPPPVPSAEPARPAPPGALAPRGAGALEPPGTESAGACVQHRRDFSPWASRRARADPRIRSDLVHKIWVWEAGNEPHASLAVSELVVNYEWRHIAVGAGDRRTARTALPPYARSTPVPASYYGVALNL
jgi:hypothetical protein